MSASQKVIVFSNGVTKNRCLFKDEMSENGPDEASDAALDSEVQSSSSPSEKEKADQPSGYEEKVVMIFSLLFNSCTHYCTRTPLFSK